MSSGHRVIRNLRVLIPLTLVVMVLLRLVWIQIRPYKPVATAYTSQLSQFFEQVNPGDCTILGAKPPADEQRTIQPAAYLAMSLFADQQCQDQSINQKTMLRINQWLLIASVFLYAVAARLLTSSWTLGLIVGALLLSRGNLIASTQILDPRIGLSLLTAFWFAGLAHYLRSGSPLMRGFMTFTAVTAAVLEPFFLVLLILPSALVGGLLILRRIFVQRAHLDIFRDIKKHRAEAKSSHWLGRLIGDNEVNGGFAFLLWFLNMQSTDRSEASQLSRQDLHSEPGKLLVPLPLPLTAWLDHQRGWKRILYGTLSSALIGIAVWFLSTWAIGNLPHFEAESAAAFGQAWPDLGRSLSLSALSGVGRIAVPLDFHYLASLFVIIFGLFLPCSWRLFAVKEACFSLLAVLATMSLWELICRKVFYGSAGGLFPDMTSYILQPLTLTLGATAAYLIVNFPARARNA